MKIVEAHEVKLKIQRYCFFERNHIAVVTEGFNGADVLSITDACLANEFEIKVSRSDLKKELDAIEYATRSLGGEDIFQKAAVRQWHSSRTSRT